MDLQNKNRLLKKIFIIPLILILFVFIITIYMTNKSQDNLLKISLQNIEQSYLQEKKNSLKQKVEFFMKSIRYDLDNKLVTKKEIVDKFNSKRFKTAEYIFVYDVIDLNKTNFARMLINPNRPDLIGKLVTKYKKDINGFEYRKDMIKKIQEKGEGFVQYSYIKPNSQKIVKKISYFKYYPKYQKIVATGVYIDDINEKLLSQKENVKEYYKNGIVNLIYFIILITILLGISLYFLLKKIKNIFEEDNNKIENKNRELIELNLSLENNIKEVISQIEERDEMILQNSRISAMNEIISMLAHQWRQPLNVLALNLMNIKMSFEFSEDEKISFRDVKLDLDKSDKTIQRMSKMINDFQVLFTPQNEKSIYPLNKIIYNILDLYRSELSNLNIKISINVEDDETDVKINKNDIVQAVFNILQNSKEALIEKNIDNPLISLDLYTENNSVILKISDNGGGIDKKLEDKILEPYISTKSKNARGLGLYRTNILIERNDGKMLVQNTPVGLSISFVFKKSEVKSIV